MNLLSITNAKIKTKSFHIFLSLHSESEWDWTPLQFLFFGTLIVAAILMVPTQQALAQCAPGFKQCPGGGCVPIGAHCCGGGTYCPRGHSCCNGKCCRWPNQCTNYGCIEPGASYCGDGRFCKSGYKCCLDGGCCPNNTRCCGDACCR